MVDVVVAGVIALDDVETPFGKVIGALGGSATYASVASSFFAKTGIVSVVGTDFPKEHFDFLSGRDISLSGVEKIGKTFRWAGSYQFDMNEAKTLKTELNSLQAFKAELPDGYKDAKHVFLANMDPKLQANVIGQLSNPKLIVLDTMNFWINSMKDDLLKAIKKADILLMNDGEARQLFGTTNLIKAGNRALKIGPTSVIIKKGEHGALLFTDNKHFNAPGYPLEDVKDPTGCGDCFGGGLVGYLAKTKDYSEPNIRKAVVYGSVVASLNAEEFSLNKLKGISLEDIKKRYNEMKEIREF